ncbi:YgjV family protein [Roseateles sp.]|uniref:YgjV family protein n=1 Tax=Roseateles sp. TaxID=1971397 RepID=UPI0025E6FB8C|nr:YgjV family protein [Roseateles sp.]MBV8035644.1 YgjV family protein [Roseateles sp.]
MPLSDWLSPAQLFGYVAFVLGVGCFLQTDDRRFKLFMTGECVAYVAHFALLGNPTAVASSLLSMLRSVLSLHTRSRWVAVGVIAANIGFGLAIATRPSDWLPLTASCLGTLALFTLQGIPMRLLMLCGTGLWIANNLIAGSIGGTALEVVVAAVNLATIVRMARAGRRAALSDSPSS